MVRFDIVPAKTALLVIDMQQVWLAKGARMEVPSGREMVPALNKLIGSCRKQGIKVIFTRHAHRADGSDLGLFELFIPSKDGKPFLVDGTPDAEIYDGMDCRGDDLVITKQVYSAFSGTILDHYLRINNIDTLIISGLITCYCCEATAREARHRDYKVIFLSDGNATYEQLPDVGFGAVPREELQRVVLAILAFRYAEVLSIDHVLQRLASLKGAKLK